MNWPGRRDIVKIGLMLLFSAVARPHDAFDQHVEQSFL